MFKLIIAKIISRIYREVHRAMDWAEQLKITNELNKIGNNPDIEFPISTLGLNCISLGENFNVRKNFKLRAYNSFASQKLTPSIVIGNNFYAGTESCISGIGVILIGNNVTLASRVTIIDHSHGNSNYDDLETPVMKRNLSTKGSIKIDDNVWICEGAIILGNVTIGKNSIVAANSVVTKNIPPNSIVGGVPAQIIKQII